MISVRRLDHHLLAAGDECVIRTHTVWRTPVFRHLAARVSFLFSRILTIGDISKMLRKTLEALSQANSTR